MSKNHDGFLTYLSTGEFTSDFITDYEYWCHRAFRMWSLFIDFDEFYGRCWDELLLKFKNKPFDSKVAKFQTYVMSTPFTAARRIYMKNKGYRRHPEVDCDDPVICNSVSVTEHYFSVFEPMSNFAEELDIEVNLDVVDSIYQENDNSIINRAINWWKLKYENGDKL